MRSPYGIGVREVSPNLTGHLGGDRVRALDGAILRQALLIAARVGGIRHRDQHGTELDDHLRVR